MNTFFSASLKDWLRQNLCSNILLCNSLPWKLVFTSILWQSWKIRNDTVFVEASASVENVLSRSILWASYYNDGWPISEPVTNTGKATIGGLLRDNVGNFLFGFSKFIATVSFGNEPSSSILPGHHALVIWPPINFLALLIILLPTFASSRLRVPQFVISSLLMP
ncbi:hypothetical protein V6N11_065089 [Hibiscus sabdariffa]